MIPPNLGTPMLATRHSSKHYYKGITEQQINRKVPTSPGQEGSSEHFAEVDRG